MCYNSGVKSKSLFTISLCALFASAGVAVCGSSLTATAATATTDYPEIFIDYVNKNLDGLVDFATDGESFAFADKKGITVVENGERRLYEMASVTALNYDGGTYYCKRGENSYSLPSDAEGAPTLADYDGFPTDYSHVALYDGGKVLCEYKIHTDGKCYYLAKDALNFEAIDNDNYCAKLKVYNGAAYALIESDTNDNGNKLTVKKLDGKTCNDVNPSYIDFKEVEKVALGTIKSSLSSYNLDSPHLAKLEYGKYYTQIDIENLSGDYFTIGDGAEDKSTKDYTFKCGDEGAIPSDAVLLVLGESGNAKVFTYEDKCYIALASNLTPDEDASLEKTDYLAFINAPDWIYSSPYPCDSTKAVELTALDSVKVTGKVTLKIGGRQFYQVQFYDGDEQVTGYVHEKLLEPYSESETEHPDDKNFNTVNDANYSEDDLVKIVVLLLIVIALVLVGLAYITYILTGKKRRALKQSATQKDEDDSPGSIESRNYDKDSTNPDDHETE